ncbi:MAG: cupin domain-containing protein [Tepidisphaeraceae bacterium]
MSSPRKAVVVPQGEGFAVWSVGDRLTFKVRAEHTAGEFLLAEVEAPPGGGPPPHIHLREDEMFYVLEGQMTFVLEEATFTAGPGSAVFLPRGKVHTYGNHTDRPARTLVWASPCNFESFMLEFGVPCAEFPTPPALDAHLFERLLRASDRHGLRILSEHKPTITLDAPPAPKPLAVLGQRVTLKLIGRNTDDRMCAALLDVAPGPGVPPHLHRREDETFYVVDGALEFLVGEERHVAPRGTTIYVPGGTFHGFRAIGDSAAQLLSIHTPAGFEHFFSEMGGLNVHGAEPSEPSAIVKILQKHGMEVG